MGIRPVQCAPFLVRGGAVWQLVGLITRRSQVQILPPLPFLKLTLQLLPVSPALGRIHGPSAIHLAPPPYFVAALRGVAPSVGSGDDSTEPTSLPNSLTGRSRP